MKLEDHASTTLQQEAPGQTTGLQAAYAFAISHTPQPKQKRRKKKKDVAQKEADRQEVVEQLAKINRNRAQLVAHMKGLSAYANRMTAGEAELAEAKRVIGLNLSPYPGPTQQYLEHKKQLKKLRDQRKQRRR